MMASIGRSAGFACTEAALAKGLGMHKAVVPLAGLALIAASPATGQSVGFDEDPAGDAPAAWTCGVTGRGSPQWAVLDDATAPSRPHVLRQSGQAAFAWCVLRDSAVQDGAVQVRFKAISGKQDQAAGVVWRFQDGENYYVARANALENNVSLYYTERGTRKTLKYVDAAVSAGQWHTLRVEFRGAQIRVLLNGRAYIEQDDRHIAGSGRVGVWTKADSVTAFDDFSYERAR